MGSFVAVDMISINGSFDPDRYLSLSARLSKAADAKMMRDREKESVSPLPRGHLHATVPA
jgi:hypothetical protein